MTARACTLDWPFRHHRTLAEIPEHSEFLTPRSPSRQDAKEIREGLPAALESREAVKSSTLNLAPWRLGDLGVELSFTAAIPLLGDVS